MSARRIPSRGSFNASSHMNERGSTTIFVLGLCVVVLFVGGLSVDFWRVIAARRALAAMADSAAAAGANGVDLSALRSGALALNPSRARQLAGDQIARSSDVVRVQSVVIDSDTTAVRVTVSQHIEFSLLGLLGDHQGFTITVSAAGSPRRN